MKASREIANSFVASLRIIPTVIYDDNGRFELELFRQSQIDAMLGDVGLFFGGVELDVDCLIVPPNK